MRARLLLLVLLGSALVFLVSLYLPWKQLHAEAGGGVLGLLLNPLSSEDITGWASGVGDAAALAALALAAATIAVLVRPRLADRMPLLTCALLTAYFAVAGAALLWQRYRFDARVNHVRYPWTYGAYIGIAACLVAVIAAAAFSGGAFLPRRGIEAVGWIMGLGLLVSLLLPWHRVPYPLPHEHRTTFLVLGVPAPSVVLAAAMVIVRGRRAQALCWVGAAVFTFGAFGFGESSVGRAYGFWLALGFALALLTVALVTLREWPRPAQPGLTDALLTGAVAVFIVSLFLPWQRLRVPHNRCISEGGWTQPGSSAAVLAFVAVVGVLLALRLGGVEELAVGTALLVATAGFRVGVQPGLETHFAFGAYVGFAAAACFLALALARLRLMPLDRRRLVVRLVPIAASLVCLGAVAVAWWTVLPSAWQRETAALNGWLSAAGLLLSLHLVWSWLRRVGHPTTGARELVLVPPALLALVALVLIRDRDLGMTWGGGIVVGLLLLLTALGWIEAREGLENSGFSEIFRVDRLPGAET